MKKAHRHVPRRLELDGGDAFIRDFRRGFRRAVDDDVEATGQEFIAAATSNDAVAELARDELTADESGDAFNGFCFAEE